MHPPPSIDDVWRSWKDSVDEVTRPQFVSAVPVAVPDEAAGPPPVPASQLGPGLPTQPTHPPPASLLSKPQLATTGEFTVSYRSYRSLAQQKFVDQKVKPPKKK